MEENTRKLYMAFYDASDGPRILLFGSLKGCFEQLQLLFRALSTESGPIEIHKLPFVKTFGDLCLVAQHTGSVLQQPEGKIQGLRRKPNSHRLEFEWKRTNEGWDYLAELIDDLVKSPIPCHQYLTAYPREDAILVVSKGEYGDDILQLLEKESSSL